MIDTVRGRVRVRAWPRKRGTPKSPLVRQQNDWFREGNRLTKLAAGTQQAIAIDATKRSGLYPRDLMLKAMSGGLADLRFEDGRVVEYGRYEVQRVSFNGTACHSPVSSTLIASTNNVISWNLPTLNPAGMWAAGEPDRLTIPPGVTAVILTGGIWLSGNPGSSFRLAIRTASGSGIAQVTSDPINTGGALVSTGVLPVSQGEQYRLVAVPDANVGFFATAGTFFTAQIVGTT